ncbi:MAG: 4'-phosphopantetheinyl transferase superfamily protein [Planctomycetes bacterium]|nr:4'-phosphopantetheinyl transferase superfamily protein [Planctomycetota bacterium]
MKLHPVLLPIPERQGLTGRERIARQRDYARRALAECCKLSAVTPWDWQKDPGDVPLPHDGYYWAIAHKPAFAAAVIADGPVGIDIERITSRAEGLFDKLAASDEWMLLGERTWEAFFRVWTAKEATLKANGIGIAGFLSCRVLAVLDETHLTLEYNDRTWTVEQYRHGDHLAAVTLRGGDAHWVVLDTPDS